MQNFKGKSHSLDQTWVFSIQQKLLHKPTMLKEPSGSGSCCIHSVPQCFRRSSPTDFDPQIVSIGPFHRGKETLQAMEEHKWKYLQNMLSRQAGNECLETYLTAATEGEDCARRCYSETIYLSSNDFAEMLVVDGLFIIELLLKAAGLIPVDESDYIFKIPWIIPRLRTDLLLLENQIPFFVLQHLFDLMHVPNTSLARLAVQFLKPSLPNDNQSEAEKLPIGHDCRHLLHLLHSILLPETESAEVEHRGKRQSSSPRMIFSASELQEAGIKFKKGLASSFLGIKFHKRVIEIPPLSIRDCTRATLLNLIMFEQSYGGCTARVVAAYASFMKCIVGSGNDASILRRSRIIDCMVGGDEEVAHLFKEMSELASIAPAPNESYLQNAITAVDRYYRTDGRARRARMKNRYFSDPWPILSCFVS